MNVDVANSSLGEDADGKPVYLRDIWPSQREIHEMMSACVSREMFKHEYGQVFEGDNNWNGLKVADGELYQWEADSTYVKNPPYFEEMTMEAAPVSDISGARVLALLGDSVTTDHISPAGSIASDSPAADYLSVLMLEQFTK